MSDTSPGRNIAAEFVGSTIVMLGGPGLLVLGGGLGPLEIALGFGVALAISIGVIGAVANPMFSLALLLSRAIDVREAATDWIGQFLGAIFGGALIFGLNDSARFGMVGTNGWEPNSDISAPVTGFQQLGVVIAGEFVLGTILVVVLLSSISQQRTNGAMAAFTGAAYSLGTLFLLNISGAGMNPARSLASAIFADTDPNALGQVWVFILVPAASAVAGLLVWLAIDEATIDDTVFDDTALESVTDRFTHDV